MVLIAGFAASIVLALIAVVGKDVLSDRVLEQWQVERQLGLPILAALGNS
jgi:capsular polysaccharide biosynthesis protein